MYLVTKLTYYGLAIQKQKTEHSIIDALSYCLFFPCLIAGPTMSFTKYMNFLHLKNQFQKIKYSNKSIVSPLILGLVACVLTFYGVTNIPPSWPLTNQFYQSSSVFVKLMIINCIGIFYRAKFYVAWYLAQISINISGISYNPKNDSFDQVVAGSIMFQIQINPKNKTQYWNTSVQHWLKCIIYEPVFNYTKSQAIATFATFLFSAFWHGIYLTYYIGFFQWALMIHLTKWVYKMSVLLPQKLKQSYITKGVVYLITCTTLNYIGMAIVILQWNSAMALYEQLNYSISISLLILFFLSFVVRPPKKNIRQISKNQLKIENQTSYLLIIINYLKDKTINFDCRNKLKLGQEDKQSKIVLLIKSWTQVFLSSQIQNQSLHFLNSFVMPQGLLYGALLFEL